MPSWWWVGFLSGAPLVPSHHGKRTCRDVVVSWPVLLQGQQGNKSTNPTLPVLQVFLLSFRCARSILTHLTIGFLHQTTGVLHVQKGCGVEVELCIPSNSTIQVVQYPIIAWAPGGLEARSWPQTKALWAEQGWTVTLLHTPSVSDRTCSTTCNWLIYRVLYSTEICEFPKTGYLKFNPNHHTPPYPPFTDDFGVMLVRFTHVSYHSWNSIHIYMCIYIFSISLKNHRYYPIFHVQ